MQLDPTFKTRFSQQSLLKRRAYAFFIDLFFLLMFKMSLIYSYFKFLNNYIERLPAEFYLQLAQELMHFDGSLFFALFITYQFLTHYLLQGRSLGNTLTGLHLLPEDFLREPKGHFHLSLGQALGRSLGQVLGLYSFGLFYLLAYTRRDRRGPQDVMGRVMVITEEQWQELLKTQTITRPSLQAPVSEVICLPAGETYQKSA